MNRKISKLGAIIVSITVVLFAISMFVSSFSSYVVCMILPIGYILLTAGFHHECDEDRKVAANAGLVFAALYATLIFIVYFAQTTAVRLDSLGSEALKILDYSKGGLFFSYDLLGYGFMALSTFFIGLTIKPQCKCDKWLKALLMIHGVFFITCFIMPMVGVFGGSTDGEGVVAGIIALEFWCAYFLPIGILSAIHFGK